MTTWTQFPALDFLTPQRYKRALLTTIDLIFSSNITEGWRFPVGVVLKPLPEVATGDVTKYVKKLLKTLKNEENGMIMDVCAASIAGGTRWRPTYGALYCTKTGLNSRRYENQSTFFFLVSGSKEKRCNFKMLICDFFKIG